MSDPENTWRVLTVDPDYAFGEREGCVLFVWRGQPTEASFEERGRFMQDLAARLPGRCGAIEVIEPTSKAPSPAARNVAARSQREVGAALSGLAIVIEGNELRAIFVRAVLAGMQLLVRKEQPMRVDKDLLRSAEWVCGMMQANDPNLPARLVEGIEMLRARIPRG
jgi:hypothetical protein